jgi:hypothetical protein
MAACLAGCPDPEPLAFELAFSPPELASGAAAIEARILRTACTGGELLYETTVHSGEPAEGMLPPVLEDSTYCFDATATNASCERFAHGSTLITLPDQGGSVVVTMTAVAPESNCGDGESCSGGQCTGLDCPAGFADCDTFPGNGCETNTIENPASCGTCFNICFPGTTCCPSGRCCADCDVAISCIPFGGFMP